MSLIEIHPDLSRAVAALNRIAHALETHLLVAYNYRIAPPSKEELSGEQGGRVPDVSYSDHESTMQHEIDVRLGRVKLDEDVEDEDDEANVFI